MKKFVSHFSQCVILLALCLTLSGCFIRPFEFDLYQGNIITPEMVAQIEPGMSQEQVRYILGSPLLEDAFHYDRWDYIYLETPRHGEEIRHHVAICFVEGHVEQVICDPLTSEVS